MRPPSIVPLAACAAALLLAATPVRAQRGLSLTVQGGFDSPVETLSDVDLKTGSGLGGTIGYRVYGPVSLYAGWEWHRFVVTWPARPFVGGARKLDQTGYTYGARFDWPVRPSSPVSVIVRAGGTYEHIETKADTGTTEDTGHGVGWEAGAGIGYTFGGHLQVAPMARIRMLTRDLTIDGVTRASRLTYTAVEAAVTYIF